MEEKDRKGAMENAEIRKKDANMLDRPLRSEALT